MSKTRDPQKKLIEEGLKRMGDVACQSLERLEVIAEKHNLEFQERMKTWGDQPVIYKRRAFQPGGE